jgi:hypothetical protein
MLQPLMLQKELTQVYATTQIVKTALSLSALINTVNHHKAQPVVIIAKKHKPAVATMEGIRSFHKFTFPNCMSFFFLNVL